MASSIAIVGFDEIRFPQKVEFNFKSITSWNTTVIVTASGYEQRNQNWENIRKRFRAEYRQLPDDPFNDFQEVQDFWMGRRGRARGFRFKDHTDFEATAEVCPQYNDLETLVGDGVETEFQIAKLYDDGAGNPYRRILKKPVIETGALSDPDDPDALVYLDTGGGPVLQTRTTDYTFDTTTGKITFLTAPPASAVVTWTGRFDVPVRFDTDEMETDLQSYDNFQIDLDFIEIRVKQ